MFQMSVQGVCDQRVALPALFAEFLRISLCSFGGGLVWSRRSAIDQRHWMSEDEFADTLSLIQFVPGPNVIGIAVCGEQSCEARQVLSLLCRASSMAAVDANTPVCNSLFACRGDINPFAA